MLSIIVILLRYYIDWQKEYKKLGTTDLHLIPYRPIITNVSHSDVETITNHSQTAPIQALNTQHSSLLKNSSDLKRLSEITVKDLKEEDNFTLFFIGEVNKVRSILDQPLSNYKKRAIGALVCSLLTLGHNVSERGRFVLGKYNIGRETGSMKARIGGYTRSDDTHISRLIYPFLKKSFLSRNIRNDIIIELDQAMNYNGKDRTTGSYKCVPDHFVEELMSGCDENELKFIIDDLLVFISKDNKSSDIKLDKHLPKYKSEHFYEKSNTIDIYESSFEHRDQIISIIKNRNVKAAKLSSLDSSKYIYENVVPIAGYPCILIPSFDPTFKCFSQLMSGVLSGLINQCSMEKYGIDNMVYMQPVQGFGFIRPSIIDAGPYIRISPGLSPLSYADCIEKGVELFNINSKLIFNLFSKHKMTIKDDEKIYTNELVLRLSELITLGKPIDLAIEGVLASLPDDLSENEVEAMLNNYDFRKKIYDNSEVPFLYLAIKNIINNFSDRPIMKYIFSDLTDVKNDNYSSSVRNIENSIRALRIDQIIQCIHHGEPPRLKRVPSNLEGLITINEISYVGGYGESGLASLNKLLGIISQSFPSKYLDISFDSNVYYQTGNIVNIYSEKYKDYKNKENLLSIRLLDPSPAEINSSVDYDPVKVFTSKEDIIIVDITSCSFNKQKELIDTYKLINPNKILCLFSSNNKLGLGTDVASIGEFRFLFNKKSKNSFKKEFENITNKVNKTDVSISIKSLVTILNEIGCYRKLSLFIK